MMTKAKIAKMTETAKDIIRMVAISEASSPLPFFLKIREVVIYAIWTEDAITSHVIGSSNTTFTFPAPPKDEAKINSKAKVAEG